MTIAPERVEGSSWEKANRLRKRLRCGVKEPAELTVEEWGLLYLWFGDALPDVEAGERP